MLNANKELGVGVKVGNTKCVISQHKNTGVNNNVNINITSLIRAKFNYLQLHVRNFMIK